MKRSSVFLDTGIFVAYLNRRDRWHGQAVALFTGEIPRWSTSILVASEAYSWFLHKMGEEPARTFRELLAELEGLVLFSADPELHGATERILDRLRGVGLTYVDASSLALLEQHSIERVWSTDHHLGVTGVEVLPRR